MKNSKMQSQSEELEAIQATKDKAAAEARAEGKTPEDVEKAGEMAAVAAKDGQVAEREEEIAQATTQANAVPEAAVQGGMDAQIAQNRPEETREA